MNLESMRLLLCTNGADTTKPALAYGQWLAEVLGKSVVVLGIAEAPKQRDKVVGLMNEVMGKLEAAGVDAQSLLREGTATEIIAKQAQKGTYLTVVGPLGRPVMRRILRGRTFRNLLAHISTPLLYIPAFQTHLKHMLVCSGGLKYSNNLAKLAIDLTQATDAHMTLLHIVEPITLDYPLPREVQAHRQDPLEADTPHARYLQQTMTEAQEAGISVEFKVRHGHIVHEILNEVREGDYDLIGMGSTHSSNSLRHLFLPNVTAEVAEVVDCPVLTVRFTPPAGE